MAAVSETPDLIDLGSCPDHFVYSIAKVENLGTCSRVTFYVPRTIDGRRHHEVCLNLIVPNDQLPVIARLLQSVRPMGPDLAVADVVRH
jgi:hypothetical protein